MKIPYTEEEISRACYRGGRRRSRSSDGYVRPVAFRGSEMMAVSAQNAERPRRHRGVAVAVLFRSGGEAERHPARHLATGSGPAPDTAPTQAKAAGLYMICTMSKHAAEAKGYADAMMFDYRGYVAEATGANIFFVKDGRLHTPIPDCFLERHHAPFGDRARQGAADSGA